MFAIILLFRIKADVIYHTSLLLKGILIANIGLDPEGKHDR
jgi:hypothetical protein